MPDDLLKTPEVDELELFTQYLSQRFPDCETVALQNLLCVTKNSVDAILKFKWTDNPHLGCSAMLYKNKRLVSCSDKIWTVKDLENFLAAND